MPLAAAARLDAGRHNANTEVSGQSERACVVGIEEDRALVYHELFELSGLCPAAAALLRFEHKTLQPRELQAARCRQSGDPCAYDDAINHASASARCMARHRAPSVNQLQRPGRVVARATDAASFSPRDA